MELIKLVFASLITSFHYALLQLIKNASVIKNWIAKSVRKSETPRRRGSRRVFLAS